MNISNFINVLPMALKGWAGVFGVIIVLIIIVAILNKASK